VNDVELGILECVDLFNKTRLYYRICVTLWVWKAILW